MGALVARKPDSLSGRPIRRLARLNEGKWDPEIPAATEVDQGVFGHVLDRAPGMRFTTVYFDPTGNPYEEPSGTTVVRTDKKGDVLPGDALFVGTGDDIATYAEAVLARYELPRPEEPGMYWEDRASGGRLGWGPKVPEDCIQIDCIPFRALIEPMATKFVEENLDQWSDCWEAPLASEYLDLWGQISGDLERVRARFRVAAADMNVSPLSSGKRRSNCEPLDFPDWAFDHGYHHGFQIGKLTAKWRLGLLHGPALLHDQRRRSRPSVSAATSARRAVAAAWEREAVRLAGEVSRTEALSATAVAGIVITNAGRPSKSTASSIDGADGEARRAALNYLARLKVDTVRRVLISRRTEWDSSSQVETSDDRSS